MRQSANASAIWEAIKAGKPTHVQMIFTEGITLDDSDIDLAEGITINDVLNGDTDLTFGKAVCTQLTAQIIISNKTRYMKWTDEFELRFGVEISGETVWVTFGHFIGERPKNVSTVNAVEYTAYDYMTRFDVDAAEFVATISPGATIADLYEGICDYARVGYVQHPAEPRDMWSAACPPASTISSKTCRELLACIAETTGYYARINSAGNCELVWFEDHTQDVAVYRSEQFSADYSDLISGMVWDEFDEMTWDEAETYTWDDICGDFSNNYKVSCVIVRYNGQERAYPNSVPVNAYIIDGNPLASYSVWPSQFLYEKLDAFGSSLPVTVNCIGNWLVEAGDIIYIELPERIIPMRIYTRTLHWNGSVEDTYETTGSIQRKARK